MFGKSAVQVSSTAYERLGGNRKLLYLDKNNIYQEVSDYNSLSSDEKKRVQLASSDLNFYQLADGRISSMEVLLPHWFKEYFGEDVDITKLDPRLLRAVGFRIPTQGMNFIENIIVKGFLKSEEGDTIVVPSALVGKSGSDFDIDKLNIYLPHYYISEKDYDSPEFIEFLKNDLRARGLSLKDTSKIISTYNTEDYKKINRSTYTAKGKIEKNALLSLEDFTNSQNYDEVAFIKKSLTNYNQLYKNGEIIYVEPGDDTMPALQNKLISLISQILSLEENYRQLLTPNSSNMLQALAEEITNLKGGKPINSQTFTKLTEWNFMNLAREQFLVSKQLTAIGAVNVTNHSISQVAGIKLNQWFQDNPVTIRFPHHTDENGKILLSNITDRAGAWISETLSEALTGFVDAVKNPFVFFLNINTSTIGTYFYLNRIGVPIRDIALFHNQPIISNYLNAQAVNESILNKVNGDELAKTHIVATVMSDFVDKAFPSTIKDMRGNQATLKQLSYNAINDRSEYDWEQRKYIYPNRMFFYKTLNQLEKKIESVTAGIKNYEEGTLKNSIIQYYKGHEQGNINNITQSQAQFQLSVLSDFLEYQQQAAAITTFITGVSYDTQRTRTIIENKIQEFNFNKINQDGFISNPESILKNTFIGEMKNQKEDISNLFSNFFVSLHPNSNSSFQKIYQFLNNDNLNLRDEVKKEFLNRYQNFFLTYLLHTIPTKNINGNGEKQLNDSYSLFFGDDSFAKQLGQLQLNSKLKENKFLRELFPIISTNRNNTDNIKLFVNRMSTYEANTIIEAAINLQEIASGDKDLQNFVDNLAVFSIIQSGLQLSPITYSKVLPNSIYTELVGKIFDRFTDSGGNLISADLIYKQFFQNNWNNQTLVPNAKAGYINKNGILSIPTSYNFSKYDFVTKLFEKVDPLTGKAYTKSQKDWLIKQKKFKELFDKKLYSKFITSNYQAYYHPINKLGNSMFATEVYGVDTGSLTESQIALSSLNGFVNEISYNEAIESIKAQISKESLLPSKTSENPNYESPNENTDEDKFINDNTCE